MTITEAFNRGNNLVATAVVALSGLAFLPEAIIEDKGPYKMDDTLLFVLGIVAFVWYNKGKNKFKRSAAPVVLVVLSLLVKIMGLFIEMKDKDDVGDDFGGLVLFVSATVLVLWLYFKAKQPKETS